MDGGQVKVQSRSRPWRRRLHAWWEGYDLPAPVTEEPEDEVLLLDTLAPDQNWEEMPDDQGKLWTRGRIEAAEIIFGRDFVSPGNADFTLNLAKPLALSPTVSLLDLHAGLGGGVRALVQTFGVWVTGQEPDEHLADDGDERSGRMDMAKKAPVRRYDPENLELKAKSFDCIFARELFWSVENKDGLYKAVGRALKDRGQLIFTDFLKSHDGDPSPTLQSWYDIERVPATPWTLDRTMNALLDSRLDCRIDEDISAEFRGYLMAAWMNLVQKLESKAVPRHVLREVLAEAERWARFGSALDRGDLKVYRFHAFK